MDATCARIPKKSKFFVGSSYLPLDQIGLIGLSTSRQLIRWREVNFFAVTHTALSVALVVTR